MSGEIDHLVEQQRNERLTKEHWEAQYNQALQNLGHRLAVRIRNELKASAASRELDVAVLPDGSFKVVDPNPVLRLKEWKFVRAPQETVVTVVCRGEDGWIHYVVQPPYLSDPPEVAITEKMYAQLASDIGKRVASYVLGKQDYLSRELPRIEAETTEKLSKDNRDNLETIAMIFGIPIVLVFLLVSCVVHNF